MLTEQQQAVVDAAVTGTNLVVEAGAGTGKTTTMVSVAEALAPKRMIYTAFTRAMVDEAGMKMLHLPSVSCLTIHQIAFRASAFPFRDRLNARGIWWNRVASKVLTHLDLGTLPDARGELLRLDAKWVHLIARDAVANYMQSDDWEITEWHISIPRTIPRDYWDQLKSRILPIAREVWDDYTNPDGQLPFVHDVYLKLYQLAERRSPTLHRTYDVAIIDEAQDVSDVMLSIFDSQPDTMQKIVVGDSAQAIFEWNGAKNSLAQFRAQGWPMLPLTNSFRFGPIVADAANAVLDRMPGMELRIVGAGAEPSEIIEYDDPTRVPNAVLCRTNASVIEQTIRYVALGLKVSAVVDTVKLQKWARAAKDLMAARPTDFVELAAFRNWRQAVDFSKTDLADPDFVGMVKLLEKHGPATLESIDDMCVPESQAEVVVITGHKAKGREWDHVKVAEDFTDGRLGGPGVVNSKGEPVPVNLEEHRLFYVALTRCRKTVDVSESTAFDLFSGGMPLVPVSGPLGL